MPEQQTRGPVAAQSPGRLCAKPRGSLHQSRDRPDGPPGPRGHGQSRGRSLSLPGRSAAPSHRGMGAVVQRCVRSGGPAGGGRTRQWLCHVQRPRVARPARVGPAVREGAGPLRRPPDRRRMAGLAAGIRPGRPDLYGRPGRRSSSHPPLRAGRSRLERDRLRSRSREIRPEPRRPSPPRLGDPEPGFNPPAKSCSSSISRRAPPAGSRRTVPGFSVACCLRRAASS
jgi:hypothetical protein